jgi:DNA-binding NtrC family response regulator
MRILIIDDEMDVLTLFKDMLETIGHKIEIAIDGESGLEKFKNANFDLVVMDYRMHGRDGILVSKDIWGVDKNAKILFASADSSIKKEAIGMGAVGFLLKPFGIDILIREIGGI